MPINTSVARNFPQVKVKIDELEFGRQTGADEVEGEFLDPCLPQPFPISAYVEYPVAEQKPVGFCTITQATQPTGVYHLKFTVEVFDPQDHFMLFDLKNDHPHLVTCSLLPKSMLMFLVRKDWKVIKSGNPEYSFEWVIDLIQAYTP